MRIARVAKPKLWDGRVITAARGLAGLTILELAAAADVTERTIRRIEANREIVVAPKLRHGHVSRDIWDRIVDALNAAGVELTPPGDDHGAGARYHRS